MLTANHLLSNGTPLLPIQYLSFYFLLRVVPLAVEQGLLPQYTKCLLALQDQTHKLMFGHFLRVESGRGDTIDRFFVHAQYRIHVYMHQSHHVYTPLCYLFFLFLFLASPRLNYMHEILEDFNGHLRVVNAGDVVPLLLK